VANSQKPSNKQFSKIHIEISNICNLQCSFCPEVLRGKKLISTSDFRNILKEVAPLTEQVAFHLMGDPLVHPHLEELVQICGEEGVRIFLVTNGVLLREKQLEILLHSAFRQVNFSLHSFPDNFPERDVEPYLEKIFHYTELALAQRPDLYINYRLWNLADPRGKNPKNTEILNAIESRFGISVPQNLDVRLQKSFKLQGRLYLHWDTEFTWPAMHLPVLGNKGRCLGLKSHFGILVDGTVVPCCLDKEGDIRLGNIHESTVVEILNSQRAKAMVKGFQNRKLVEPLCQRCQYIERFG